MKVKFCDLATMALSTLVTLLTSTIKDAVISYLLEAHLVIYVVCSLIIVFLVLTFLQKQSKLSSYHFSLGRSTVGCVH